MDRDGENQDGRRGTARSSTRNSRSSGGRAPSPTRTPPHPHPLPSTTSRTGPAGQTLKHRDVGQAARGGKASSGSQSGRQTGGRRVTTVADFGQKTKHQAETEGRPQEERESMRGQGRGRAWLESRRGRTGGPWRLLRKGKVATQHKGGHSLVTL